MRKGLGVLESASGTEADGQRARLSAWYAAIRQAQGRTTRGDRVVRARDRRSAGVRNLEAEAHASYILDWAWVSIGRYDCATHSERALEIYAELGDLSAEAAVLVNTGGFAYYQGRWDEAVTLYERARDTRLRTGNDVEAAMCACNIAEVLVDQGHYAEAERELRDALRVCRAAEYQSGAAYARYLLARVAARDGRFGEAHEHFDRAHNDFVALGIDSDALEAEARRAECLALEGRAEEALALADRTLRAFDRDDELAVDAALLERVRGYAFLQQREFDRAGAAFAASLDGAARAGSGLRDRARPCAPRPTWRGSSVTAHGRPRSTPRRRRCSNRSACSACPSLHSSTTEAGIGRDEQDRAVGRPGRDSVDGERPHHLGQDARRVEGARRRVLNARREVNRRRYRVGTGRPASACTSGRRWDRWSTGPRSRRRWDPSCRCGCRSYP